MLVGEFCHTLDEKGRVSLPKRLRSELGPENAVVYITRGLQEPCLFVYPEKSWLELGEKAAKLSLTDDRAQEFVRTFFGGSIPCEIDKNGRISLTNPLKNYAHLEKDVVVVGNITRLEIWDAATWNERFTGSISRDTLEHVTSLGII